MIVMLVLVYVCGCEREVEREDFRCLFNYLLVRGGV